MRVAPDAAASDPRVTTAHGALSAPAALQTHLLLALPDERVPSVPPTAPPFPEDTQASSFRLLPPVTMVR